jgi:hypothetical protein
MEKPILSVSGVGGFVGGGRGGGDAASPVVLVTVILDRTALVAVYPLAMLRLELEANTVTALLAIAFHILSSALRVCQCPLTNVRLCNI